MGDWKHHHILHQFFAIFGILGNKPHQISYFVGNYFCSSVPLMDIHLGECDTGFMMSRGIKNLN